MLRVVPSADTNSSPSIPNQGQPRHLANPDAVILYLTSRADAARQSGRVERAGKLELPIWEAFGNKLASAAGGSSALT